VKAAAPAIREKDLREQIRSLVKIYGWRMAFTQYSLRSPKGFPDLVLVRPPRIIFAELKSLIGKTTPEQDAWLADLEAVASEVRFIKGQAEEFHAALSARPLVEVHIWRPADIEKIAEVLR
jgi:hypothetical protein